MMPCKAGSFHYVIINDSSQQPTHFYLACYRQDQLFLLTPHFVPFYPCFFLTSRLLLFWLSNVMVLESKKKLVPSNVALVFFRSYKMVCSTRWADSSSFSKEFFHVYYQLPFRSTVAWTSMDNPDFQLTHVDIRRSWRSMLRRSREKMLFSAFSPAGMMLFIVHLCFLFFQGVALQL